MAKRFATEGPFDEHYDVPHTTVHTGTIHGGTALNILAEHCTVDWHYRGMPNDDKDAFVAQIDRFLEQELLPAMRSGGHFAEITNECLVAFYGLTPEQSPAVELVERLTDNTERNLISFGTEAGAFQKAGIPAVVLGPGDINQAHRPNEYIEISQLQKAIKFLNKLCDHCEK